MSDILKRLIIGNNIRRTLIRAGVLLVVSVLVFRYLLAPLRLEGESMEPNYRNGSFALANRLAYFATSPERGDVVAVRLRDSGRSIFLLKRVVGLPGESISFKDGQLIVDGIAQEEAYLVFDSDWNYEAVSCEANEYFVVGDNRSMPIEQHIFGRTYKSRIVGKLLF